MFFNSWFRVEVSGIENLPESGAGLVVANHAGVLPFDGLMASVAVRDHHPAQRNLRLLAADMVFDMPAVGQAARKASHTMACTDDAHRLLVAGELTAVFPEGYKGLGKRFKDRYKLQRFGRGGSSRRRCARRRRSCRARSSGPRRSIRWSPTSSCWRGCSACPTSR